MNIPQPPLGNTPQAVYFSKIAEALKRLQIKSSDDIAIRETSDGVILSLKKEASGGVAQQEPPRWG